jgi:hypothetical protein
MIERYGLGQVIRHQHLGTKLVLPRDTSAQREANFLSGKLLYRADQPRRAEGNPSP